MLGVGKLSSVLSYLGFGVLVTYFLAFQWVFKVAGVEQTQKYYEHFAGRSKFNLIGIALLAGAFFVPSIYWSVSLLVAAISWVVWTSYQQKVQMQNSEFEGSFANRLFYIGFLAIGAMLSLYVSNVWL